MRKRRCNICGCELYKDERGSYCQDCRGILNRTHECASRHWFTDDWARENERRVKEHAERVAKIMGWES